MRPSFDYRCEGSNRADGKTKWIGERLASMVFFTTPFKFLFAKRAFKESERRIIDFNAFSTMGAFNEKYGRTNTRQ